MRKTIASAPLAFEARYREPSPFVQVRQPLQAAQRKAEASRHAARRAANRKGSAVGGAWADTLTTLKASQLITACSAGDAIQAQALITKRADPDSRVRESSALGVAVAGRHVEVVRLLLHAVIVARLTPRLGRLGLIPSSRQQPRTWPIALTRH